MPQTHSRTVVALAVVLLVVTPLAAAATDPATAYIDANHGLATDEAIKEYEQTGSVTTDVTAPDLTLTAAEDVTECSIEDPPTVLQDVQSDFFCITNHEEIKYRLRIYVPSEYFSPYRREDKVSLRKRAVADFAPIKDGRYTRVTVTIGAKETVVFEIPERAQAVYRVLNSTNSKVERLTGEDITQDGGWRRIPPEALSGDKAMVEIRGSPEDLTIQYDSDPDSNQTTWLKVPESDPSSPVYQMQKAGVNGTVYVVSTVEDAPPVRYRRSPTHAGKWGAAWRDVKSALGSVDDLVGVDLPDLPDVSLPDLDLPDISLPWSGNPSDESSNTTTTTTSEVSA